MQNICNKSNAELGEFETLENHCSVIQIVTLIAKKMNQ